MILWVRGVTHQYELTLHHDVFGCVAKQTLGSSLYVVLKLLVLMMSVLIHV